MKPERLQAGLAKIPGWQHDEASQSLVRHFEFPTSRAACAYGLFLSEMAESKGIWPRFEIHHNKLTVIIEGGSKGLTDKQFEQARQLGQPF